MQGFPDDPGLERVLRSFGVSPGALLGHGGEAWVYALDGDRVIRVLHAGGNEERIRRSHDLVRELSAGGAPFDLPELLDIGEVDGRWYAVERRLSGVPLAEALAGMKPGRERDRLVEAYLEAVARLGDLALEPRGWFGDLLRSDPIRTDSWRRYLEERIEQSLRAAGPDFEGVDAAAIAGDLPDTAAAAFVHLDAFPGNVLVDRGRVTAVIDFGDTTAVGDRRLDALAAAVYLMTPEITPTADAGDADGARQWLASAGLLDWLEPATRWLAAYWSFAAGDVSLHRWCRAVLLEAG